MNAKYLVVVLVFMVSVLGAESIDPSKLEARLISAHGEERLALLTELCRFHLRTDPGKVLEYGRQIEETIRQYPDDKTELTMLDLVCQAHLHMGNYEQALVYGGKSLEVARRMGYEKGMGIALSIMGIIHNQRGDYSRSRELSFRAVEIFQEYGEKRALASSLNNIGISYDMQGNYEKALDYYLQSLKLKEEFGDRDMIARSLNNIGVIQLAMGRRAQALQNYNRALQIKEELGDRAGIASQYINLGNIHEGGDTADIPMALSYYRKALDIYRELDSQSGISSVLFNIGNMEVMSGNYRSALDYYEQSLVLRRKMGEKDREAQTLIELGKVYLKLQRGDQALRTLEQGFVLAREIGVLSHVQEGALALSESYESRRNYVRALSYYKEYKNVADQIFNAESRKRITELQVRYESEKQEQEIELLKKNNEIQQLRLYRQALLRNLMMAVIALIAMMILFLGYRYRYIFTFWKKKNYIGHYRILEQIGCGGMGTVYRAADVVDGSGKKTIAIKVLREEFFNDDTQKKRFKQEASIVDQAIHPNIVRVIERGETDNGLYIAMEMLEGPTLAELLMNRNGLAMPVVLDIMTQIADALKSIHAMGIVHRDLKPDNIKLVEENGNPYTVKLMDFGLAITGHMNRLTETGIVVGTIFYLSPEQLAGEPITNASDIHSLGVIFYEMLAGVKPFIGESTLDVMKQILSSEPMEISRFIPSLDRHLAALVMMMLQKNPRQRPSANMIYDLLKSLERQE